MPVRTDLIAEGFRLIAPKLRTGGDSADCDRLAAIADELDEAAKVRSPRTRSKSDDGK